MTYILRTSRYTRTIARKLCKKLAKKHWKW